MSSMRDFAPSNRDDKPEQRHNWVLPTVTMILWLGLVYMFVLELTA